MLSALNDRWKAFFSIKPIGASDKCKNVFLRGKETLQRRATRGTKKCARVMLLRIGMSGSLCLVGGPELCGRATFDAELKCSGGPYTQERCVQTRTAGMAALPCRHVFHDEVRNFLLRSTNARISPSTPTLPISALKFPLYVSTNHAPRRLMPSTCQPVGDLCKRYPTCTGSLPEP